MRRRLLVALIASTGTGLGTKPHAQASPGIYTPSGSDLALGGYDTVAYFAEGVPRMGAARFTMRWHGAAWRFTSAENLERFRAAPDRYAPQYGGHCAWAASRNYLASGDPRQWRIVDGRLFLNYDAEVQQRWLQDIPNLVAAADRNWPGLQGGVAGR